MTIGKFVLLIILSPFVWWLLIGPFYRWYRDGEIDDEGYDLYVIAVWIVAGSMCLFGFILWIIINYWQTPTL